MEQVTVDRSLGDFEFLSDGSGIPLASTLDQAQARENASQSFGLPGTVISVGGAS